MRKISVFKAEKIKHKNYPHIQSFIKVERTGLRRNKKSEATFYYISSKVLSSKKNAAKIRGHWLIENQVHWVKDVIFNEDKSKIRELQVARNFSLLYTIIMNV
jgi:predicted transposase YbfD/YdcC